MPLRRNFPAECYVLVFARVDAPKNAIFLCLCRTWETYTLHVYRALREVVAAERVVVLKNLRCAVRVVWVYRKTQWVALMTTDLTLTIAQIVEYCSARCEIEAGFREIKHEIGSAHTQTRNPDAVVNHLHFCMAASGITWIYGAHLKQAPIRRSLAKHLAREGLGIDARMPKNPAENP